jgi:hypothetical protein
MASFDLKFGRGYFPNTRTSVNWFSGLGTGAWKSAPENYSYYLNPVAGISLYYYFNPQLRLNLSEQLNLSYIIPFGKLNTDKPGFTPRNSINASLSYALF